MILVHLLADMLQKPILNAAGQPVDRTQLVIDARNPTTRISNDHASISSALSNSGVYPRDPIVANGISTPTPASMR